jgi:hypothetical protein
MRSVIVSVLLSLRASLRDRAALQLEIVALRHQLHALNRSRPQRLRLTNADRILWVWLSKRWNEWRAAVVIVRPKPFSPGIVAASGSSGRGKADAAWVDQAFLLTSAC